MTGERGYLELVRRILTHGRLTTNRTQVDTKSIFGAQLHFDLTDGNLPMLTTKFVSFPTVATELFWFLRGDTNQQWLAQRNVNIWRGNSTREFLDSINLQRYREHESLGPIYGFQWRHFGAKYTDCHADYTGCGYDQLANVLDLIQNQPNSRRIIMSAWNPMALSDMALPPCHVLVQFEVDEERRQLSAHMYQRSADLMLGVPYNILSYSLLTHILARKCKLSAGHLVCSYGNAHIYLPHIECANRQLEREPFDMPKLTMLFEPNTSVEHLDLKHFKVENYKYHPQLKYTMF